MNDIYARLAKHLENLVMGYPFSDALIDLLKEMFSPVEARVALAIPNNLAPLETADAAAIAAGCDLPEADALEALASMASRNMLYTAPGKDGARGYALLQVGYGMPQTFFWGGGRDDRAKRMAGLVLKYFTVPTTGKIYGGAPTKTYKYSPASLSVNVPMQGVLPHERMEGIVAAATKIAVAHCPCRMSASILGRTDCPHSLEVCIKYDEMAEFAVAGGLAREISGDEALHILGACEKEGLVHMVDNAEGRIKHTCNCCGCYCWNVGVIRRRKIPRDVLMAVYFIRETEEEGCIGCGACEEICPVDAVRIVDDRARVDTDWCIGCGVCGAVCPTDVIRVKRRIEERAPANFTTLHEKIRAERQTG
ncbi:MAG: 4Fe-4S dicluster domain-containing protein [Desulfobacterales bacterium]|nr:4Fe-4S dicluster domain-containing protein [Desulfobacterales bacterium]